MKIYIAAPYTRKAEMTVYAETLRARGIEVTSSWLDEPHEPTIQMPDLPHENHLQYALNDIQDILDADAMIFFTDPTKTIVRAGRHVEFGMVLFWNALCPDLPMPIFVVGLEFENIFHHCPNVRHYEDWDLTLDAVCRFAVEFRDDGSAGI